MPKLTSVADVISVMPSHFVPDNAAGLNAVLQLDISGNGGGQWHMVVADKQLTIREGVAPNPNMTLKMESVDYLAMINGEANPMQMFMAGKVKVGGDISLALKMQSMFKMQ